MSVNIVRFEGDQLLDEINRHLWVGILLDYYGMKCELSSERPTDCKIVDWLAGEVQVIEAELAHQTLSPVLREGASWDGSHLFVIIVRRGAVAIRQNGVIRTFDEGSVLVLDPLNEFTQRIGELSRFTLLRLSRSALQDRGIPCRLDDIRIGDASSQDVRAVRDFLLLFARQGGTVSGELKKRLAEQCLDLMDIVLREEATTAKRSSAAAVVLRAKQVIARLARNPDLDLARIARELNVSTNYLTRAFRSAGQSPMRYVMSLRLDFAAQLLGEGTLQVKEIAFRSGFINASHFSNAFRLKYGMTPREFSVARQVELAQDAEYPSG
ncbi:helix-turn-helix domain-containing protein [Paraburkholderia humisilvae]|uniref:HTH-type transcriptional activator RhaS n=1 Tax=Paraburkholderia humisilvae TaxID=627669 RepID=A0A6J5EXJ8_9BURK|nr:AraC family transcriptional regulator [Paraburkholderia humisilvae]CAB3771318.1 HTH-type transcriptional activator RhaS [Paraburkholderia humisilvae]